MFIRPLQGSRVLALTLLGAPGCLGELPAAAPSDAPQASPTLAPVELEGPGEQLERPPVVAAALPLRAALSFATSEAESCSVSWTQRNIHGVLELRADARGRATFSLDWDGSQHDGSWGADDNSHYQLADKCELKGRARVVGGQLNFEFDYPKRDKDHDWWSFECRTFADQARQFTIGCVETVLSLGPAPNAAADTRERALRCYPDARSPNAVLALLDDQRSFELLDERLHVSKDSEELGEYRAVWLEADPKQKDR